MDAQIEVHPAEGECAAYLGAVPVDGDKVGTGGHLRSGGGDPAGAELIPMKRVYRLYKKGNLQMRPKIPRRRVSPYLRQVRVPANQQNQ